jgi:hypothetical protein
MKLWSMVQIWTFQHFFSVTFMLLLRWYVVRLRRRLKVWIYLFCNVHMFVRYETRAKFSDDIYFNLENNKHKYKIKHCLTSFFTNRYIGDVFGKHIRGFCQHTLKACIISVISRRLLEIFFNMITTIENPYFIIWMNRKIRMSQYC